ncbi:hypothetical protein KDW58_30585, partial [Burkholderia vietnamiensis]|nr:hypothetical protein [Burkholderia vietnamiensis]
LAHGGWFVVCWFPTSTIRFSAKTSTAFNRPPQLPRTPNPSISHNANVKVSTSPFDRIVVGGSAALEKAGVVTEVAAVSAAVSNAENTAHGAYDRRPNALR